MHYLGYNSEPHQDIECRCRSFQMTLENEIFTWITEGDVIEKEGGTYNTSRCSNTA